MKKQKIVAMASRLYKCLWLAMQWLSKLDNLVAETQSARQMIYTKTGKVTPSNTTLIGWTLWPYARSTYFASLNITTSETQL